MGADYSYYVKTIASHARAFLTLYILAIGKAELPLEGIFFPTQFPSKGIFINKKVGNRQN